MKTPRVFLALLAAAIIVLLAGGAPQAFHSGGVAECNGCHSMHASPAGASFLLVGTDGSSTCLTCHMSPGDTAPTRYHIATADADMPAGVAPIQRNPGGDFGWLRKTYSWVPRSGAATEYSYGQDHGHNIVAVDKSYAADTDNSVAPGGTFVSSQLGCQSCHDPHGRVRRRSDGTFASSAAIGGTADPIVASGSYNNSTIPAAGQAVGTYRLLRGLNDVSVSGVVFNDVAIAVAPATYNQSEAANQVRVAYGAAGSNTWGNWCASCHPNMHSANASNLVHPVDETLGSDVAAAYNAYVKSGDLTGQQATSYNSLIPFAESTGDFATLASHASNSGVAVSRVGPSANDRVMCLSCHRAHASGFDHMLRFNLGYEFMVYNGTYTGTAASAQGRNETEMSAAYYDRPVTQFATYQRVLCNKCHAKD